MSFILLNGKIIDNSANIINAQNRGFRYGDGFFETMRFAKGSICLQDLHFERQYSSLELLQFEREYFPQPSEILQQVEEIARKNNCKDAARIRLTVFAGDGHYNSNERKPNYIIEASPLQPGTFILNKEGVKIGFCREVLKVADRYSAIKSNNFLAYIMAGLYARENGLSDCLLFNPYGAIADASIANVFIVKDGNVLTPSLADGCVNGVMRKYLLSCMRKEGIQCTEMMVTEQMLLEASEVFLTNAVKGITWVGECGNSRYSCQVAEHLHRKYLAPLCS